MRVLAVLAVSVTGCLAIDSQPDEPAYKCERYTGVIFEPADQATVSTSMDTRIRWNESGIPDRYISMSDDYGNFFQPAGQSEILGDGSHIDHYTLPAGGAFNFEMGWFCDAGNDGPTVPLAKIRFYTAP